MGSEGAVVPRSELPSLPAGWRWVQLRDLVDQTRGICYGIVQPGRHVADGVPMVNSQDVSDGEVSPCIYFRVSRELHDKYRRSTITGGEILITLVGAKFGKVAIAPLSYAGYNCSRAVGIVPVTVTPEFVMFCLRSPLARTFMDNWANTTAQPTFNLKDVASLPIPLPPEPQQRGIANILGTLDDKIELNRRMNDTLEAIARALFKSWFVDFDPVRAKAEGRDTGLPKEIADLFPDSFEDSELGEVPKGWVVRTLKDLTLMIRSGATPRGGKKAYVESGDALIRSQNVYDSEFKWDGLARITPEASENLAGVTVHQNDVLLNITGASILRTCIVPREVLPARVNQHVAIVRPRSEVPHTFIHSHLLRKEVKDYLLGLNSGASREAVTKAHIESVLLPIPTGEVLGEYQALSAGLYEQMEVLREESATLAGLRDTLLPKLVSGQIRADEARS